MRHWAAAGLLLLAPSAHAQLQASVVAGVVLAPDGAPVPRARVVLADGLGHIVTAVEADRDGRFTLRGVAPGPYQLRAETKTLGSQAQTILVAGGLPVSLELHASPQRSESVSVDGSGDYAGSSGTTIASEAVRRAPAPLRSNVVRLAVAETPGWTSEDNGLVHYHGADDGPLFVVDGIPVYERLDPQFGLGLNAPGAGSVRVLSGHVPAEFGLRSGGVVEVQSLARTDDAWSAFVEGGAGGDGNQALSGLGQAPLGKNATLAFSLSGERSRRYLDPVSLGNYHNAGHTRSGDAKLIWTPGGNVLTAHAGGSRSSFDVPNAAEQAEAGQDQRQKLAQAFATLNWQRAWSTGTVSQIALFGRRTSGTLTGSAFDTPISSTADRRQDRVGVLGAVTRERGRHRLKAGFEGSWIRIEEEFGFVVTDQEARGFSDAALAHTAGNPFAFSGRAQRPLASLYLQDAWRAADRLTIDAGLRYDRSRVLLSESQWSPRVGASYRAGKATFRVSVDRFFQPPQTEYLLLASSPAARALSPFADGAGGGGADVPAERTTALEGGVDLRLGTVNLGLAGWRRSISNAGDPNVFFGTSVVFPNSVDRGRARGLDVHLELPRRGGVAGFLTYTLAKVEQFGPINGGLFLEDDYPEIGPGTQFTPDHDQRHALSAELQYENDQRGRWLSIGSRYRSGTPLQVSNDLADLVAREGAEFVDFARARTRPYWVFDVQAGARLLRKQRAELSGRVSALNITDARYAFNFGSPFSGTHFGAPRTFRADLRLALR